MKTINGFIYSKTPFEGWKFRAKFEILFDDVENRSFDIYTNCENNLQITKDMETLIISKHITIKMVNWSSKEQDELTAKFIEETLKNW